MLPQFSGFKFIGYGTDLVTQADSEEGGQLEPWDVGKEMMPRPIFLPIVHIGQDLTPFPISLLWVHDHLPCSLST